jgi:hypothetical protein
MRLLILVICFTLAPAVSVFAQTDHHDDAAAESSSPNWEWSWDANAFAGWNYQRRKFRDFSTLESQNWLMGAGERDIANGRLGLRAMLSFEPFTLQRIGSPQVFQTGETYEQAPLVDYQHPHDLFMGLGARWTKQVAAARVFLDGALVGSPALGPAPFMHRASAAENPTAPLSHHQLDATHISHGVITAGATRGTLSVEGSWFRGAEPDENRKDLDLGALDSWAARVSWRRGAWEAQASGGYLTTPEAINPFDDVVRLTASIGFAPAGGRLAATLAWGQNREVHGTLDGYLLEATYRWRPGQAWYTRAELVTKDILSPGRHDPGSPHLHPLSRVGALTGGYVHDLLVSTRGRLGVGGDATVYYVDPNLRDNYGAPVSFHIFLRYRPDRTASGAHQH